MSDPRAVVRPPYVVLAAALLFLEAVVAFVFGVLEVGAIRMSRAEVGLGVALLMFGYAILLVVVARALLRGRRWSRGPAIAMQLILLPVAWSFKGGETTWVAVLMIVVALGILVGILHPRSTDFLVPADQRGPIG